VTIIARRFRANPARTASQVWEAIADLVCGDDLETKAEFLQVAGVAASLIADEAPRENPLVVAGTGPRLRVYCLYDENAIDGEDANEDALSWSPTEAGWKAYLPCPTADISWVSAALSSKGTEHFEVYDISEGFKKAEETQSFDLTIDEEGLRNL
jgi:hypothetical protein